MVAISKTCTLVVVVEEEEEEEEEVEDLPFFPFCKEKLVGGKIVLSSCLFEILFFKSSADIVRRRAEFSPDSHDVMRDGEKEEEEEEEEETKVLMQHDQVVSPPQTIEDTVTMQNLCRQIDVRSLKNRQWVDLVTSPNSFIK